MEIRSHGRAAAATVGAAVLLLAAGCGADDPEPIDPGEVAGELRIVTNWTGAEGEAFQAVIDAFEDVYPDVTVTIEQVPFDQTQALLTQQFAQGSPPDVSVAFPGIIRALSDQDLLLNLDELWDGWVADGAYTQSLRDIAEGTDGRTYAVYFKGNVNGLVWYDPAQLETLGITPPTTWDELTAAADAATAAGVAPFAVGGKDGWPLTQWVDPVLLRVAGPDAYQQLARGEIGWDDPRVVEAFEVLGDLVADYFPDTALSAGFIDATCARAQGDYLFQNQGAFINLIVPAECDESITPGEDLAFFPLPPYDPSQPAAQAVSGDLFVGARDTANRTATLALLEYLGSAEAQTIWAERGGYVAPNAQVPVDAYPDVNDRAAAELWPKTADVAAGYDLDDWIGGEIQVRYRQALADFVRDPDVDGFIAAMVDIDQRAAG